ncbi:hypothetical protein AB0I28_18045 [Phytomonospora sp. NPDC050363]|uniref:hypothetical protein n=1 Tax=Phytomonospora sp. NPDC050363 TaxID=3155642 RepID=UPI0033FAF9EE
MGGPADFEAFFRGGDLRVPLAWDRLAEAGCTATIEVGRSAAELGECHTTWYADAGGAATVWDAPGARPLRVREAGALQNHDARRTERLAEYVRDFAAAIGPVRLVLPAYTVNGDTLLLDGAHRAVAAWRARPDLRVLLWRLHGPADEKLLPHLRHHR